MRELQLGEMNAIVRAVFELPSDADSVVEARLKHMQRLGFPAAGRVGQGRRRPYAMVDVLKVVMVFQLVDAGLPSALALRLVAGHWEMIVPVVGRVVAGGRGVVAMTPNVISDLSRTAAKRWGGGRCVDITQGAIRSARVEGRPPSPRIVIDLAAMVQAVRRAVATLEGIASDEISGALQAVMSERPSA